MGQKNAFRKSEFHCLPIILLNHVGLYRKQTEKKEETQQQKVIPDSNKSDGRDESDDYDDDDNDDDDITVNITTKFVAIYLF